MAAILEIVAGFLGVATELGKCIAAPIKRQFNYLCCFSNNIQSLRDEARNLEAARDGLQTRVDRDENNAQVVDSEVQVWLDDVTEIQGKLSGIEAEITTARNGGFRSRFSLSKKAKKTAEAVKELQAQSRDFRVVSHPRPPPALVPIPLVSTYEFESRKHIEDQIMANLRDNGANMVGICGMGGVGKTTMAKRIMHRVREEHLFEEIVMAVVSQKVDMLGIQGDVAKSLGLELNDKESLSSRAHDLRARLRGKKRTLLVLDDIWENLKLEDLGISCDNGCKVLLTSRDSDTFRRMYVEKVHSVRVLSDTEAGDLFRSKVGSCIEQENVVSVARQVIEECKGLPIALVTVGVALRDVVNLSRWKAALRQLKSSNPRHMPGVLEDVYRPLRFSYESLKSAEEKSLFLLCCLFPEDYDIPLDDLPVYAMGLRMCEDITSLERARETVCSLVERLKSCFLLLEGCDENHVKMHDVVRDVAIFIASEEKRINCNDCTWISPNVGERRIGLDAGFPNLHLLMIDRDSRDKEVEINDDFFQGMRELNVFSIECSSLQQLPQTTKLLTNLRTLVLDWCGSLKSISVVGELVNLEILICRRCWSIESLPTEIGRLSGLRLLELTNCHKLETIPPGIISNLKGLEELIVEDFDKWEAKVMETERKNASLSELQHLSSLTRLYININDSRLAAQKMQLSPNITKYGIAIGDKMSYQPYKFDKKMKLKLPGNISLGNWIRECVRSVERMSLEGDGSKNLDFGLAHNMRSLTFKKCSTMKKLVNVTTPATVFPMLEILKLEELNELAEICDIDGSMQSNSFKNLNKLRLRGLPALQHLWKSSIGPDQRNLVVSIFNQLSSICIVGCNRLRTLFSLPVMESGCFLLLERLEINDCRMMEQVLWWNKEEEIQTNIHITLVFPKLKLLRLNYLPTLMSFGKGTESIEFPLLEEMDIYDCPMLKSFRGDDDSLHLFCKQDKVKFGCLKVFKFGPHGYNETWRDLCPQIPSDFFVGLRELKVSGFANMQSLFSLSLTTSGCVLQLEKLEIESCKMMEQLLLSNDKENHIRLVFPKLKVLILRSLETLMNFSKGIESIEFPLLEEINIYNCPLLTSFVSTGSPNDHDDAGRDSIHIFCKSNKVNFGCLKVVELKVDGDYEMRRNWCPQIPIDFFTGLHRLQVCGYKGMKSLFSLSKTASSCLLQLQRLEIESCDMMEHVFLWNEEENKRSNIDITLAFPKLKFLSLKSLPRLVSFSKGIVSIEFPHLEDMNINNCPLLESFVSTPKEHDDDDFIHLIFKPNKVKIGCLKLVLELNVHDQYDEMRRNWCSQIPIDFFTGLCALKVSGYQGMKSLCSLSMTANIFLLQLRRLVIESCDMMEQVFLWNEEENQRRNDIKLVFPKLKYLGLISLPRLTSFTRGIQTIEFPLLLEMKIYNCPLLKSFVSTKSSDDHDDGDHASMHFSYKVKFDCLTKLNVHDENAMMRNWCRQIDFFAGLRELRVSGFKSWKSLFSFSITESGCLLQLEKLAIYSCDMMEQVILWNEEESQTNIHIELLYLFPKLKFLNLDSLPRLRSFNKGIKSNDFLVPARMRISNCPLLRSCVSSSSTDASIHLICKPHKVETGSLKVLEISGFDEIRRNWCPQIPTIDLFAGVCELLVSELKGMKSLFPCSIARNLRNLKYLRIECCKEMVTVIEDDACCVETQTPPNPLFPNLECIYLAFLEKLKSFCEWRCPLQLPNLTSLYINKCHVMEEFTSGPLNKPLLAKIRIDDHDFSGEEVNNALQLHRLKIEEKCKMQLGESSTETEERRKTEQIEM